LKNYFKIILFAGALVFLIQSSITPFIHNHPQDLLAHYDCPAYILNTSLVSFFFFVIISLNLKIPFLKNIQTTATQRITYQSDFFRLHNKAPPTK